MTDELNIEELTAQVRAAHAEAERKLDALRDERGRINDEIKDVIANLKRINRLHRAATPRRHDGDS